MCISGVEWVCGGGQGRVRPWLAMHGYRGRTLQARGCIRGALRPTTLVFKTEHDACRADRTLMVSTLGHQCFEAKLSWRWVG